MRAKRETYPLHEAEKVLTWGRLLSCLVGFLAFILLVIITLGLLPELFAAAASLSPEPEGQTPAGVHLVESNWQRVVLELNTPSYAIESDPTDSAPSHLIRAAGLTLDHQAGKPALPLKAVLLGIPPEAEVEVEVLEVETEVIPGRYWISAAPTARVQEGPLGLPGLVGYSHDSDTAIYGVNALYPVDMARVEPLGFVRDQHVARVVFYPFQFNPATGQLVYHRRMKLALKFSGSVRQGEQDSGFAADGAFEQTLTQTLLNYDSARAWRASVPISSPPVLVAPQASELSCKITIERDGIYGITYRDLQESDCTVNAADPRLFHMYNRGQEVAIQVVGEDDGSFDPGDKVRFYGQGLDSKYTDANVYWLVVEASPAVRMALVDGQPTDPVPVAGPFLATVRVEEDRVYWPRPTPSSGRDYWFWERFYATPTKVEAKEYPVVLPFPADGVYTMTLRVAVKSHYDQPAQDPDHHLKIYLNDSLVADTTWDGEKPQVVTIHESQSILQQGANTLRLVVPCDLGAPFDVIYLDWFEVDYYRTHDTDIDELAFANAQTGIRRFAVRGFSESEIELFDVSQPATAGQIISTTVSSQDDVYSLEFQAMATSPRRYLALTEDRLRKPADIAASSPSALSSPANGADYVIVTHADLQAAAQTLAAHRAQSGLRVLVVDVQDIYDEFNFGIFDPEAIREFLRYAYAHWQRPAPSYVLLLGDGNRDFHDNLGIGETNYVPPYIGQVDPWLGETSSDNRYVAVSGDDILPDMHVGRLPASDPAEASMLVAKVMGYEETIPTGGWIERATFVADNAEDIDDFAAASDVIAQHLPASYQIERMYYGITEVDASDATDAIVQAINKGSLLVNYVGHGAVQFWAAERLLTLADINRLTNDHSLPLILPWTCYNGLFDHPGYPSFGESIVRAEGKGAVASWSPTGLGLPAGHQILATSFFDAVFADGLSALGPATTQAKLSMMAQAPEFGDLVDTYLLLGDPATRLHVARPEQIYLPLAIR